MGCRTDAPGSEPQLKEEAKSDAPPHGGLVPEDDSLGGSIKAVKRNDGAHR